MLYKSAHILRDKLSWLWNIIEWMNGVLFSLRYGKRLKRFVFTMVPDGYDMFPSRMSLQKSWWISSNASRRRLILISIRMVLMRKASGDCRRMGRS